MSVSFLHLSRYNNQTTYNVINLSNIPFSFFEITLFEKGGESVSPSFNHEAYSLSLALCWPSIQPTNIYKYSLIFTAPNFLENFFFLEGFQIFTVLFPGKSNMRWRWEWSFRGKYWQTETEEVG